MTWIYWLPLAAVLLHIVEEFVWPGGFAAWDRAYRPAFRTSITTRFHWWINGLLLLLAVSVGIDAHTYFGAALWLALAALLAWNAVFHLVGTWRTRRYSPGLVTSVGLYLPLAIWGYPHFVRSGTVTLGTAVASAIGGSSYQLWGTAIHRIRSRRRSTG
jgi:hypothetical protein